MEGDDLSQLDKLSKGGDAKGGLNKMDVLDARGGVDLDLIEELIAGLSSGSGADQQQQQLQGLQQFSVESASRVVHVRAAAAKKAVVEGVSSAVVAAGVGWGLGSGGGGGEAAGASPVVVQGVEGPSSKDEAVQRELELAKKRQLRSVRKAFGLQPTPLQDTSAQLLELGAGAWQ